MELKARSLIIVLVLIGPISGGLWKIASMRAPDLDDAVATGRLPRISPEYGGIILPPNSAPLNFVVDEPGDRYLVRIHATSGRPIEIVQNSPKIILPIGPWKRLAQANRGQDLQIQVYVKAGPIWERYDPIVNHIAEEDIDSHLVYRMVGPIHNLWRCTAVYQCDLTNFGTSVLLDGSKLDGACVNCHSFPANRPDQLSVGIRGAASGPDTLLANADSAIRVGTPFGYTAWHPAGRIVAYSANQVGQFFHSAGPQVRDVIDVDSDLAYYCLDSRQSRNVPHACEEQRLETYPAWSPDGRYLYYCSAPMLWDDNPEWPPERYDEVQYDLKRIAYDASTDCWSESETVLSAETTGLSALLPRVSPDGRYLLFCMCRYGCFPVYQPTSDLYLMDLSDFSYRKLKINSDRSESYHSWSSNSRWIAFSSRRQGGMLTRCYLSYVDKTGHVHKPFVLPQKDPTFYDSLIKSICVPELVTGPVTVSQSTLVRAARAPSAIDADAKAPKKRRVHIPQPGRSGHE